MTGLDFIDHALCFHRECLMMEDVTSLKPTRMRNRQHANREGRSTGLPIGKVLDRRQERQRHRRKPQRLRASTWHRNPAPLRVGLPSPGADKVINASNSLNKEQSAFDKPSASASRAR